VLLNTNVIHCCGKLRTEHILFSEPVSNEGSNDVTHWYVWRCGSTLCSAGEAHYAHMTPTMQRFHPHCNAIIPRLQPLPPTVQCDYTQTATLFLLPVCLFARWRESVWLCVLAEIVKVWCHSWNRVTTVSASPREHRLVAVPSSCLLPTRHVILRQGKTTFKYFA